jgi:pyruvate carboxylase
MPGGQYTNLKEQARSLGIDDTRWPEVARTYAEVNDMFGDIIKVTPTSKVVGDLTLLMVSSGLSRAAVLDPDTEVAFPESVVSLFRGDVGQPYGGFPQALQRKVLKGTAARRHRAGKELPPADLAQLRAEADTRIGRAVTDQQFASYLMYPGVFSDYAADRRRFSDIAMLSTPVFFYGMQPGEEISVDLERGKTLIVRYVTQSEPHEDGTRTVFFELNGQPRSVRVIDRSQKPKRPPHRKGDAGNPRHVGAPMPGTVTTINVTVGQRIARGDVVTTLEAMKMEAAVRAEIDGEVTEVLVQPGMSVDAKDLLVVLR